jgi:nucleotide-binding universal stress UspA family protein
MNTSQPPPVVVAVDGTSASAGALRFAVLEAGRRRTSLRVVHVLPVMTPSAPMRPVIPVDLEPSGRLVLERAVADARTIDADLPITSALTHGARVAGIVAEARGGQVVVVGRETRRGLERLLTGSTTAGVASRAKCPVIVVADHWEPPDPEAPRRAVVGLRSSEHAADALAPAFAWADEVGASLTVVHAWELPDPYVDRSEYLNHADKWRKRGLDILDEALAPWRKEFPQVPVQTRVVHGQAASILYRAAEDADLLFLRRSHEHRPFEHLGSTVRALLLASGTPVVVMPTSHDPYGEPGLVIERAGELVR